MDMADRARPWPGRTRFERASLATVLGLASIACVPEASSPPARAPACASCPPCAPGDVPLPPGPPSPSAPGARTVSGDELPAGNWKEIALETVILHHTEEQTAEAERFRGYISEVHAALAREFTGHDVTAAMRDPVTCHAYLAPRPWKHAGSGHWGAKTSYGKDAYCELHFIAASALPEDQRCCTVVGERRSENSDHRGVAHEYGGVLVGRLNRARAGWRFGTAPSWFVQGYEEYLAVTLSNEHSRKVTFEKYKDLVRKDATRVGWFGVANEYTDGSVLLAFLHADFGREKVHALLLSKEKTFWAALGKELGVGQDQLMARWKKWRTKALGAK